ncbi:MAG: hypothetical protein ABIR03_08940 [Ginsengibacter sp.]
MENYVIKIALNHSIIIAVIIGMIRFKKLAGDFYPFLLVILAGLMNESLSLVLIYTTTGSNTINSNVFVLVEYALFLWQFYRWEGGHYKKYYLLAGIGLAIWVADNLVVNTLTQNNSLFRVFYSFVILFLSIYQINKILIFENDNVLKNACFIICFTFLFYYGMKAFVESFNMFHLGLSKGLLQSLWIILYFVNVVANLLYAIAILCIPPKLKFTFPY